MNTKEYEQKKQECWEEFKRQNLDGEVQWQPVSRYDVFCAAFDSGFALGKEKETISQEEIEKAWQGYAKEIGLPESLNYATRSMIEIAIKQAFKAGAKLNGKQEKDAETVIQGWVAVDDDVQLVYLYSSMPTRGINMWNGHGSLLMPLDANSFPDLSWSDEPQEVELIIKRKKNG